MLKQNKRNGRSLRFGDKTGDFQPKDKGLDQLLLEEGNGDGLSGTRTQHGLLGLSELGSRFVGHGSVDVGLG